MAGRLPTEAEGLRRRLRTLEFQRQLEEERYRLQQRQAQEMEALRRGLAKQLTGGGTPSRDVQAMYYQVKAKVAGGYFADAYDVLNAAKYAEQQDQAVKEAAALDSAEAIVPAARMVEKHRVELIKMQRDQVERSKKFHEALFLDPARQAERSRVHTPEPPPARVSRLGAPPSARGGSPGPPPAPAPADAASEYFLRRVTDGPVQPTPSAAAAFHQTLREAEAEASAGGTPRSPAEAGPGSTGPPAKPMFMPFPHLEHRGAGAGSYHALMGHITHGQTMSEAHLAIELAAREKAKGALGHAHTPETLQRRKELNRVLHSLVPSWQAEATTTTQSPDVVLSRHDVDELVPFRPSYAQTTAEVTRHYNRWKARSKEAENNAPVEMRDNIDWQVAYPKVPKHQEAFRARAGDAHPNFYRANQSDVHSRLHDDMHSDVHNRSVMAVIGGPAVMDELMASQVLKEPPARRRAYTPTKTRLPTDDGAWERHRFVAKR